MVRVVWVLEPVVKVDTALDGGGYGGRVGSGEGAVFGSGSRLADKVKDDRTVFAEPRVIIGMDTFPQPILRLGSA